MLKTYQRVIFSILSVISVFVFFPALALDEIPNSVGGQELWRQEERERALSRQNEQISDVRLGLPLSTEANKKLPLDESPCFYISDIVLEGSDVSRFQVALKTANDIGIHKCLGQQGIKILIAQVQAAIAEKGYITTLVFLSPQNLKDGVLKLSVLPGLVRRIYFGSETKTWNSKWNALPISSGNVLNIQDIEQGLENFRCVPTAQAEIKIEAVPASDIDNLQNESDLIIQYQQQFPLRMLLSLDDSGSPQTGRYQGGMTISYDNPLRLNDLFYITFNHDLDPPSDGQHGSNGYAAYYSVPFGYSSFALNTNEYQYNQMVAGSSQSYNYSGVSHNAEASVSYLLYRDHARKTTARLGVYYQTTNNFIDDTEVEIQARRMGGWELGLDHREFIQAATLDFHLNYQWGTGIFGATPAPEEEFDEGTARPSIFSGDLILNIPFTLGIAQQMNYNGVWRWQWTPDTLIPQDRFGIGGRYTVRGFDGVTILSAENGWLLRNDLGFLLGKTGQELYFGVDYGQVSGPSAEFLLGTQLAGAIVGLRGGYKIFSYDLFSGWPIVKPIDFVTATPTVGFSMNISF